MELNDTETGLVLGALRAYQRDAERQGDTDIVVQLDSLCEKINVDAGEPGCARKSK